MKVKLLVAATLLATLFNLLASTSSSAVSPYDDLVDKTSTSTLINYIDSYYGKNCGSPTDDYAERWLYEFKRQDYNHRSYHAAAVASLETAVSSPDGAYAVTYEQKNNHNNTSNPYFVTVYWTEHDKASFETVFTGTAPSRSINIRQKPGVTAQLHTAVIASPSLIQGAGNICRPEFLWGYTGYESGGVGFGENSTRKLFVSTFDTSYPSEYEGSAIQSNDPALTWAPSYEDLVDKVSVKQIVNKVDNYYGKSCGSLADDYSTTWIDAFKRQQFNHRPYHADAVASFERAMANGAYAISYDQRNNGDNTSNPYFITIYWVEDKTQFKAGFYDEAPSRRLEIRRAPGSTAMLHTAVIASPKLIQNDYGPCEAEFLWGYTGYESGGVAYAENTNLKLFKSTFDVDYPSGFNGIPVPGNPTDLKYLALGDSYSSGEGDTEKNSATNQKYYRHGTDVNGNASTPHEKCHIGTRSYPYALANWMQLNNRWDTIACSGAVIYDANQDNKSGYEGQWNGKKEDVDFGRLHGFSNKSTLQAVALNEMIPGRKKQVEFVEKYQPKVITLTMGGNDVDFGGKLENCVTSPSTCDWAKLSWRNKLKNELRDQYNNLKDLYEDLKIASNNQAKVYVLGYPQFINGALSASCENTYNLDSNEREMIVNSVVYYNNVIEQAAKAAGVKYIDIESALGEHRLCDSNEKHVTAITNIFGLNGNERQESFHPNAKGHKDIADRVKQEVGNQSLMTYDTCPNTTSMYCVDSLATKETITTNTYFTITNEDEDSKFTHYQVSSGEFVKSTPGNVSTMPYTFDLTQPVEIIMYSDPVTLATVDPEQDGSLNANITIPSTVAAGVHTLTLKGKAYSGEDLEVYQTVLVKGLNANDVDENNVNDSQQACGAFIPAANQDEDFDGIDDACDPEVTEPVLYGARNGNTAKGEDPDKLYLHRNIRASSVTGIANDYDSGNKEALVGFSLTVQAEGVFNKFIMLEDDVNPSIEIPTIFAKDATGECFALQAVDYLSPALNPSNSSYQPRGLVKLSQLPDDENCI